MNNLERLYDISLDQYNDLEDLILNGKAEDSKKILEKVLSRHLDALEYIEEMIDVEDNLE